MLRTSTIQLLRFPFSFFLMPVFWFALSQVENIAIGDSIQIFIILHGLIYPASNAYNSYMDRDTGSIGGLKNPKPATQQLFYASLLLDTIAVLWSAFISLPFFVGIIGFIAASRAYSYRGIRLKKFPFIGYLTVIIFQGGLVFFFVMHGSSVDKTLAVPVIGMVAASLLIGGFYPLTQIYQHMQDRDDGVITLSYVLGYRGTFLFTAIVYLLAIIILGAYLTLQLEGNRFLMMQIFQLPVLVYFIWWFSKIYKDTSEANYENSRRMNIIAAVFTNAAFIYLLVIEKF